MAKEKRSWGYDRIVGALANLGLTVSAQRGGHVFKGHAIPPAPERKKDRLRLWKMGIRDGIMAICCALPHRRVRMPPWQPMVSSGYPHVPWQEEQGSTCVILVARYHAGEA